jgi:archaemetzincin
MSPNKGRIGVVAIGDMPRAATHDIANYIQAYLDLPSLVLPPLEHPSYAYDERRQQFNAATILKACESLPFQDYDKVIGLLNVDLFIPVFTHVLGEAREGGKFALASMYRLRTELDKSKPSAPQILERLAKVALHEIGHLLDVPHCMNEGCLMHYSSSLQVLDAIHIRFCTYCSVYLTDSIRRHHLLA